MNLYGPDNLVNLIANDIANFESFDEQTNNNAWGPNDIANNIASDIAARSLDVMGLGMHEIWAAVEVWSGG